MNARLKEKPQAPQQAADFCDLSILLPADFALDSGETLSRPELRVRVYGDVARPVVALAGGVSSGRIAADEAVTRGWWRDVVASGGAVDLDKFCVLAFDFLPNPEERARTISTADQARGLAHALGAFRIEKLFAFVGASYGGMVALAFAAAFPDRVENLCVISAADRAHPAATALRGVQRRIIEFAERAGDAREGVALARQLAMIAYRTPEEFEQRFDHQPGAAAGDPYAVCDYLIARGRAYPMSAERYVTLSDSVDRHRIEPQKIRAASLFIGAASDRLVPTGDMRRLAAGVAGSSLLEIDSLYGHDAFLKETGAIGPRIKQFLEERLS